MTDWNAFLAMGGYAAYVWPAYAVSVVSLLAITITSWKWMTRAERLASASKSAEEPVPTAKPLVLLV